MAAARGSRRRRVDPRRNQERKVVKCLSINSFSTSGAPNATGAPLKFQHFLFFLITKNTSLTALTHNFTFIFEGLKNTEYKNSMLIFKTISNPGFPLGVEVMI